MDDKTIARFFAKVDKNGPVPERIPHRPPDLGPCWLWTAALSKLTGYGRFKVAGMEKRAHRVAFEIEHGSIPEGECVLHHCDNEPCVNHSHLFLGSHADNVADCIAKGRRQVISDSVAAAICSDYAAYRTPMSQLAVKYSVCKSTICLVIQSGALSV